MRWADCPRTSCTAPFWPRRPSSPPSRTITRRTTLSMITVNSPRKKTVNPAAGWYNAKHRARPLAVPGLSVKIRFFWFRHSHRETQTSKAFPTCLRRPYLFSCKRKDRGEKSAWTRLVRAADTIQVSTNFIVVANTHRYLTTAMVRAACYGTPNL